MTEEKLSLKERLEKEIGSCLSSDLQAHIDRGAIVIVHEELALLDAALAVAEDDAETVGYWIEQQKFVKPTQPQIDTWKADLSLPFSMVIVQPYVLVQPLTAD